LTAKQIELAIFIVSQKIKVVGFAENVLDSIFSKTV